MHLDDVLALPGFVKAQRFQLASTQMMDALYKYFAVYEIETEDLHGTIENLDSKDNDELPVTDAWDYERCATFLYTPITDERNEEPSAADASASRAGGTDMGTMNGRVAFITGAARGQGRAHALKLASEGAAIVATDVVSEVEGIPYPLSTKADLDETVAAVIAANGRAISAIADVRSQEELDSAVAHGIDEFGHIDICVANAGVVSMEPFWTMSERTWGMINDINLAGCWRTAKAVASHMIERRSGVMVMTSSANGIEPAGGIAHSVAAKHALLGLAKNIALELAEYGIRCNSISPVRSTPP